MRLVFLKQFRDAGRGDLAALSQLVEARGTITTGSLRWRMLANEYDVLIAPLDSHPLMHGLGLERQQSTSLALAAQFGFRIDAGEVVWPRSL